MRRGDDGGGKALNPGGRVDGLSPDSRGAPVVQLCVHARGRRSDRRIAALRHALEAAGADVLVARSTDAPLEIDARADHVCAVGGDGTLRHVVAALHRSGRAIPASVYPVGTVNLLARERGYSRVPEAFARQVLAGETARHHTALIGDVPLLTCASVGPDARAVAALSPALKARIGRVAYLVAILGLLQRWPRPAITVSCEGQTIACEAVYIAKGRFFAGPWSLAPQARLDSPRLHVVTLREASRRRFLRFAWALLRGQAVTSLEGVRCLDCTALTIVGDGDTPLQADGDVVAHLPVTITLRAETTAFA